ncbi:MAG: SemiSWEET family sugar transporter [Bacteroidia bacterium]
MEIIGGMDFVCIIGIFASIFAAISLLPQLLKIIKEKKIEGISFVMIAALFFDLGLWTLYGILKKDWIIFASNGISLLINLIITILSIKYKKN